MLEYTDDELQHMLDNKQISSQALVSLLEARSSNNIDFTLIDVREVFEFTSTSIEGTDLLLPTSMIQNHLEKLEKRKEENVIIYCRTGSRTGQVLMALQRMGFEKVSHLSSGILSYAGKTQHGAEVPNAL